MTSMRWLRSTLTKRSGSISPRASSREQTKEELEWIINVYYRRYGFGLWATTLKETNEFIGRCGLLPWTIDGREEVEVAYLLAKEHWGRGLGTEAAGRSSLMASESCTYLA